MSKVIKGEGGDLFDPTLFEVGSRGVVTREQLLASDQAREILERARREAARIRQRAEQVLQEALREREEEKARGFDEGRQEGLAELTSRIAAFERQREATLEQEEKTLLAMVLEIAKKVIGRELKKGAVADIVRQAIAQAVGEKLVIRLHPEDKKRLEEKGEIGKGTEPNRIVTLQEDESITPGGCLVETEFGSVDARLETQWTAIRHALGLED